MLQRVDIGDLQQTMPVVDGDGRPSPMFLRFLNGAIRQLKVNLNLVIDAQNAASAANEAAAAANAATAQTKRDAALINSYIEPASVLSATPTTISVAAHVRRYADGTSANVSAGTVATTGGAGAVDYVSYVEPQRDGGTVAFIVSTTPPVQTGDTHVVGAVTVPATGTQAGGSGPPRPGNVNPLP